MQFSQTRRLPAVISAALVIVGICTFAPPLTKAAPPVPRTVETSGVEFVTPQTEQAIEKGLVFLAARQQEDGSFGSGGYYRDVAVTGLAGMSFLAAGHTPGRGRYGEHVRKAVDFILASTAENGFIRHPDSKSHGPMYGHGFATLFLAEVYGMTQQKEVRQKLERAVKLIVDTQNEDGGWRYYPHSKDADLSVTVCEVMALRAARNSGIFVPKNVVTKSVEYVKRSQNPDGGFRYQLQRPQSLFPRSAAGVVTLYSAGIYEGREIDRGLNYLIQYLPRDDAFHYESGHYFYGQYYAVQAMWHAGGDYWSRWYPAIRDELLSRQLPTGGWRDRSICDEYGTAMALLVLQMPNNYLPIFQR